MRRLVLLVALAATTAVPAAWAATYEVAVRDNFYDPDSQVVASGDTIRWTNRGLRTHTVTFATGRNDLLPGQSIQITFTTPGTYSYRCDFHGEMRGTVVVTGPSASSSTTSTTGRATSTTSTTQDARGSAITAPPETTTTTTTTTTTVPTDDTTTTVASTGTGEGAAPSPPTGGGGDDNVDGPSAVAALLLLGTAGATLAHFRGALR